MLKIRRECDARSASTLIVSLLKVMTELLFIFLDALIIILQAHLLICVINLPSFLMKLTKFLPMPPSLGLLFKIIAKLLMLRPLHHGGVSRRVALTTRVD